MNQRWPSNERRLVGFFLLMLAVGLILDASLVGGGLALSACGALILVSSTRASGGDP